ncbi:MAG: hypothetical protein ACLP0L_30910 [Solirubrobacteraceae bacterium]
MNARLGSVRKVTRVWTAALLLAGVGAVMALSAGSAAAATGCQLGPGGSIKHVIVVQFDNVHLVRDNPNVPSDIEQIPALYNFMKDNGTLLANDHTVLISHTSDGILSTETGLYPDEFGGGVANTFPYLNPSAKSGTSTTSLFTYWTDPTNAASDPLYTLIHANNGSATGVNTPAPWVAITRAGCDFAGVGSADMEFENDTSDLKNVYGANSTQYQFGNWSYNTAYDQYNDPGSNLGETDYEGLAIHCSLRNSEMGGICSSGNGGEPDTLPSEPGGYSGYNALFGAININPFLTGKQDQALPAGFNVCTPPHGGSSPPCTPPPSGNWAAPPVYDVFAPNATNTGPHAAPVNNLEASGGSYPNYNSGPPQSYQPGVTSTSQILDETGSPGFPGFDGMEANNALGYTAALQEAGVPVTYTYISDVHDDQYYTNHGNAFGPGEAGHEAQLREYNAAFTAFFRRLARDGITKRNTLFLATVDEGDHYDGSAPLNPGCNGVTTPCDYDTAEAGGAAYGTPGYTRNVGEVDTSLPDLLKKEYNNTTFYGFDFDDAPALIVPNQTNPQGGTRPGPNDPTVRTLERDISGATEYNPITGTTVPITVNMADETEETILHMVNSDPNREPTLTLFGDPSFYFQSSCDTGASSDPGCPIQNNGFAWNHGDIQPEIATTWQGWVGPGIKNLGETSSIWTDHTDARPTMMTVLGLHDDYSWDGAAIAQIIGSTHSGWDWWGGGQSALPWTIRVNERGYEELTAAYQQLDAPFGEFGLNTLDADTSALASNTAQDATYTKTTSQLQTCESKRTSLVGQIQSVLQAAESGRAPVSSWQAFYLVGEADRLISDSKTLAAASTPPSAPVCG